MSVEIKTQPTSSVEVTKTSASVSIDNSIQASATIGTSNNTSGINTNIDVGASVKTGTIASASAGLENKNVFVNVEYSDTTEAHVTANSNINYHGLGNNNSVDAYAKSGTDIEASLMVGKNGVDVNGGVSSGSYVGVDISNTINLREASATAGGGVTVGDHLEIGGGGKATFDHGKATIGVSGDVAVLVGAEVDLSVTIDTHQIQKDVNTAINVIHSDEVKTVTHTIDQGAKKAGKEMKKAFKKIKI